MSYVAGVDLLDRYRDTLPVTNATSLVMVTGTRRVVQPLRSASAST